MQRLSARAAQRQCVPACHTGVHVGLYEGFADVPILTPAHAVQSTQARVHKGQEGGRAIRKSGSNVLHFQSEMRACELPPSLVICCRGG